MLKPYLLIERMAMMLAHTLRVYTNAMRIAQAEGLCDLEIVGLSALLHDADDYKLFQTENNANARMFLEEIGAPKKQIDQICRVINAVSFSKNRGKQPESLEGKIVQDADRLDAIGAVGIARTFPMVATKGDPLLIPSNISTTSCSS